MAQSNVHPTKEVCTYFCVRCRDRLFYKKMVITYIFSPESCFKCVECGEAFKSVFKVGKSVSTASHRCGICSETFQSITTLTYHSYRHSGEWPFRCSHCSKGFAAPSNWKQHMDRRIIIREIDCLKCLKRFRGKYCPGALASLEGRIYCESCSTGSSPIEYVTSYV
ncbi:hypothetical protein TNIN_420821 [Trichonephila inaurata madagascariensis]|uniref:C2H2-type domain-containing protein n=1 Tax=Trichonephila inaurata madagascariensis TaxID=2747483 RepID=A0A8X6YTG2_9ARAC|nr:hypothetical protein TNIN_420821 [Trichonephila inaurata madagascariensis]